MKTRARSQLTLVAAFMLLAAALAGTAHAEGWGPLHGYSTGGNAFEDKRGDGGPYMGAHFWSGSYYGRFFDRIQFSTIETDHPWTDVYGSWGGAVDNGVDYCGNSGAPGGFVVGIKGRADYYVDALGLICSDGFYHSAFGGTGGNEFFDKCPDGEMVLGFRGRAGSWMDSIQIYCGRPW